MRITFIGMSNVGKTYWAKRLEKEGFNVFYCDNLIEKQLEVELKKWGFKGIQDVAKWMGQPYEQHYNETSQKYLEIEVKIVSKILDYVEFLSKENERILIDTTGSVIYLDESLLSRLKLLTKIIYLDTPFTVQKEMLQLYIQNPKPVIWGTAFQKQEDESCHQALARCYPNLLKFRIENYKKYSDFTLNYFLLRSNNFKVENLLWILKNYQFSKLKRQHEFAE